MIVLAGDIGGTNSRLAIYEAGRMLFERIYPSAQQTSLEAASEHFMNEARGSLGADLAPQQACFAVAGPIDGHTAQITNLRWFVDARSLESRLGIPRVRLANDFEAAAFGVTQLGPEFLAPLGDGLRQDRGPMVVAGPGTGLGQAFLFWSEEQKRYRVTPSEAGHGDFAARTPVEWGLRGYLAARYGRVSYERVISGPAFKDLVAYLLTDPAQESLITAETRMALTTEEPAAVVVRQAVAGRDPFCSLALNVFASALGAYLGNLALTVMATGGVFIGGGIAQRMVELLRGGPLRASFEAKGRFKEFLTKVPIFIITSRELGLLGAAALAAAD
jgi:glucokinase